MSALSPDEIELGRLAIERRLATREQVKECADARSSGSSEHLARLLVSRGYVGQDAARGLYQEVQSRFLRGYINRDLETQVASPSWLNARTYERSTGGPGQPSCMIQIQNIMISAPNQKCRCDSDPVMLDDHHQQLRDGDTRHSSLKLHVES